VTFSDAISLALRNLRQSKLRTALTTLGVAIGIASLAGMVSLGVGLQDQFVGRFTRSGMFDSVTVMPASVQLNFAGGRGGRGRGGSRPDLPASAEAPAGKQVGREDDAPRKPLDDASLAELAGLEHVREVYPVIRVPVELTFADVTEYATITGIPLSAEDSGGFQTMAHGEFLRNETETACMLSLEMAKRLAADKPGDLIGKEITVGYAAASGAPAVPMLAIPVTQVQRVEIACPVVGIVERETGPMAVGGAMVTGVMMPLARTRAINQQVVQAQRTVMRGRGGDSLYPTVTVKVTRPQHTQDVQAAVQKLGYSAFSLNDALEGAKRAFLILDIILGLVGSIALAVASLGIMNTMVMSILERTREIGIMKAIGGSDSDVRRIFLIEASIIGLLGGIAGILLGWGVGRIINFAANYYIVQQGGTAGNLFALPIWLIAAALGFSVFVSLAAGAYPARRAARLDPIHALRHD
jgi:putative ABC transport system permease protein